LAGSEIARGEGKGGEGRGAALPQQLLQKKMFTTNRDETTAPSALQMACQSSHKLLKRHNVNCCDYCIFFLHTFIENVIPYFYVYGTCQKCHFRGIKNYLLIHIKFTKLF